MQLVKMQRQIGSMKTLIKALEGELAILRARDYASREEKIAELEASVESERAMNATLTQELSRLEYKWP